MALIVLLALATALHVILLASDSADYKFWVYVQMAILLAGILLLLTILNRNLLGLVLFFLLSIGFTYISAVLTNYGHSTEHLAGFVAFWLAYGLLVARYWREETRDRTAND